MGRGTKNLKGTEQTLVLFKKPEVQYIILHQLKKGTRKFWISDVNKKAWAKAHQGAELLDEEVIVKTWDDRLASNLGAATPDRRVSTFMTDGEAVERLMVLMMGGNGYARHLFETLQKHGHFTRSEWFKVHELTIWSETNFLLYGHY
jgi:hypothetical protein